MLDVLRDWIVGIAAAAFLTAIAQAVCPEGTVKRVTRMAGGLVLILAVVRPLLRVQPVDLTQTQTQYDVMVQEETERAGRAGDRMVQQLIEEKTAAYILTEVQTRKLSLAVSVRAEASQDGSYPLPYSVRLRGSVSAAERASLSDWIDQTVGIPAARQKWEP